MIRKAEIEDLNVVANLASMLWPDHSVDSLVCEFEKLIKKGRTRFFIKYDYGTPVGFAQCSIREDYVEGTSTSPVGYLEGIFVLPKYRFRGYGKVLLLECEKWAKENSCTEFASDCSIPATISYTFHLTNGFKEKSRIICFSKKI